MRRTKSLTKYHRPNYPKVLLYLEHENDTHVIVMEGQMEMGEDEERNLEVNEVMDKVEDFEKEMFFFVGLLY